MMLICLLGNWEKVNKHDTGVIAENKEKYINFNVKLAADPGRTE